MHVLHVRRRRTFAGVSIAFVVGLFANSAAAQSANNACECMVAVCQSMQPGAQNASRCESLRRAPPEVCRRQLGPMLQMLQRQHRTPPPVCTGTASPTRDGGPTTPSPSSKPTPDATPAVLSPTERTPDRDRSRDAVRSAGTRDLATTAPLDPLLRADGDVRKREPTLTPRHIDSFGDMRVTM